MNQRYQSIIAVFFTGIWINASEFFRNEVLLRPQWVDHFQSLGLMFPSEPINGIAWVVWGFMFATAIYLLSRSFTLIQTAIISWFVGFVLMWIVAWNLNVLPIAILPYALPLSMVESFVGSYMCKKLVAKGGMKFGQKKFVPVKSKYVHTNIIARDWQSLAKFYQEVFGCTVVPPERHYKGADLERGTGVKGTELHGVHLRLPGFDENGPTLEIYSYTVQEREIARAVNRPGFAHIAFLVDDVERSREVVLKSGGSAVGETVTLQTSTGAKVTWCYLTDPEGNIIELQSWR